MDFLKELFGEEALTYEQFSNQMNERGLKLADLSTGNYVGKKKYEDEISAKAKAIEDLQTQIKTRDKDIKGLQEQLAGNADDATKIADLTEQSPQFTIPKIVLQDASPTLEPNVAPGTA